MRSFLFYIFMTTGVLNCFSQNDDRYTREWGTYFNKVFDSEVDGEGNLWTVSGTNGTMVLDTLVTSDAHQAEFGGGVDVFLAKFSPEGELLYASYFGGENNDWGYSIDIQGNNLYLTGQTSSAQNIATPGSHQENLLQNTDPNGVPYASNLAGYLAQFDTSGVLQWSTYFQGDQLSYLWSIAAGNNNDVYVWGMTKSSDMATPGAFRENVPPPFLNEFGEYEVPYYPILAKFDDIGELQWATYYGPDIEPNEFYTGVIPNVLSDGGLAIDAAGNVYVGGRSDDTEGYYGTFGTHQTENAGDTDIFFSKFSSSGDRLWSSYYGGSDYESLPYIHIGRDDSFYVTGRTYSFTGIATPGSFQTVMNTTGSIFLAKFNLNGQRLWGTYFNTGSTLWGSPCFADENGAVFLAGSTEITANTTTSGSWQEEYMDKEDLFVVKFNSTGSDLLWGSYYGGFEVDATAKGSLAVTEDNEFYLAGYTGSFSGIASEGSFIDDPETGVFYYGGFIAKFTPCPGAIVPTGDSEQEFLSGDTLDSLEVNFTDWSGSVLIITWYADAGGAEVLPPDTVLEDGQTYYVSQQIRGCDESGLLAVTVTETMGVADQTFTDLKLYPNPNNGKFTISGLSGDATQIKLYAIRGREVYSNDYERAKSVQINLKGQLRTGIYFLEISTLAATTVIRVLVE